MEVCSTMPYFQPNHLVTVTLPDAPSLNALGLDPSAKKPPKLVEGQPTPLAMQLGMLPNDVIVSAVINGVTHDATSMNVAELGALAATSQGPLVLTALQTMRTANTRHTHTWPTGGLPA